MSVVKKSATKIVDGKACAQVYWYDVYRHPDGRRRTPRKHTVRILDQVRLDELQRTRAAPNG